MLALLLALSSDCAGLVPAVLPQPVEVEACGNLTVDGSGDVSATDTTYARTLFFDPAGRFLGSSSTVGFYYRQVRGWYTFDYGSSSTPAASWTVRISGIDRDGTVLGESVFFDRAAYSFLPDPRGGAFLFTLISGADSWSIALRHISPSGTVVDGPKTLAAGKGGFPNPSSFAPSVVNVVDGTILITTQGSAFPPLRNNQLVARWFDPFGSPITSWFVAIDQTLEGGIMLALPGGGMALWSDAGQVAIHAGSTAVDPTPGWIPADRFQSQGYSDAIVLSDRIAIHRSSSDPCEQQLDILTPSGNLCGTLHFPLAVSGGVCGSTWGLIVGTDGTVAQNRFKAGSCGVRWWPRLLGH